MPTNAALLTQKKAAELMNVSAETLRRWALKNAGPPRLRIGKRYYYKLDIIESWQISRVS